MNVIQLLKSAFAKKKKGTIKGDDRLILVDPKDVKKGDQIPLEYNTVEDVKNYTTNDILTNGISSNNFTFTADPLQFGPIQIPFMGILGPNFINGMMDLNAVGIDSYQYRIGYLDLQTQEFAGVEIQTDYPSQAPVPPGDLIVNMSARGGLTGLQPGFSAHGFRSGNPSADHYMYDQDLGVDIGGVFVFEDNILDWISFNRVDADNWEQHSVTLNETDGYHFKFNQPKVSGSLGTPGSEVKISPTGIIFPSLDADPSVENGKMYYNTVTNKMRVCENNTWVDLV